MSCTMCSGQGRHERGCPAWAVSVTPTQPVHQFTMKSIHEHAGDAERKALRDQFAMAALQGLLACDSSPASRSLIDLVTQTAYDIADAMLKARDR